MEELSYGVVANIVGPDKVLRKGSKVWLRDILGAGQPDRWFVDGISHGGRRVAIWVATKALENFRAAWFPLHMRRGGGVKSQERAKRLANDLGVLSDDLRAKST